MQDRAKSLDVLYPEILRFVRRRVSSTTEAEDVTQEAFASAVDVLARSADAAPPTLAWLYTVARRRLVDAARRRRAPTAALELVGDTAARFDSYGGLVASALEASLARLSDEQRAVVILRLLEGASFAEIGARLGASEEACRMRFMRALELVRAHFEEEGLRP